ncbi:hypothetical protein Bhyg_02322, partial [Pseudolycoriella hygida]
DLLFCFINYFLKYFFFFHRVYYVMCCGFLSLICGLLCLWLGGTLALPQQNPFPALAQRVHRDHYYCK